MRRRIGLGCVGLVVTLGLLTGLASGQAAYQSCHVAPVDLGVKVCRTGAGKLYAITINTKGPASSYLYVYDAASQTGVPVIRLDTSVGQVTLIYNIMMTTGVTVVSGFTAGADMTIATE